MRPLLRITALGLIAGALAVATHSYAQDFVNAKWIPLTRNGIPVADPIGDATGGLERDVVGDAKDPAAFVYQDATYLYFRLRVNGDPIKNGEFEQFGWGCAIEANNTLTSYEFLSVVNGLEANGPGGQADAVEWIWNQTTTNPDAVGENADVIVGQFQRSIHARVVPANTSFGANPDFFIEWAVPLTTIRNGGAGAPGIAAGTALRFACGTSNNARAYDADPACALANAQCTLSNTWSDPIECGVSSCGKDTDGDGVMDHVEIALGTNPNVKDTDGDGIDDNVELTPTGGGPFFPVDTDGDGTIDAKDNDSDNDGVLDKDEGSADVDGDGKANFRDEDDDNDGILTSFERIDTATAKVSEDVDGDGKKNWYDDDADGDGVLDGVEGRADQNANGTNDYLEKSGTPPIDGGVDAGRPDAATDAGRAEGGIDGPGIEGNPVSSEDGVLEGGGFACNASAPAPRFAAFAAATLAVLAAFVLRRRRR